MGPYNMMDVGLTLIRKPLFVTDGGQHRKPELTRMQGYGVHSQLIHLQDISCTDGTESISEEGVERLQMTEVVCPRNVASYTHEASLIQLPKYDLNEDTINRQANVEVGKLICPGLNPRRKPQATKEVVRTEEVVFPREEYKSIAIAYPIPKEHP